MIALTFVLFAFSASNDPVGVLHRISAVYENLRSFELAASLSVKVPGQDLTITTGQTEIYATGVMLPADAPVPVLQFTFFNAKPVIRNGAGQVVKWNVGEVGIEPFLFSGLDAIDKRVISARALPDETLDIGGESMLCAVVEAIYEQRTPFNGGSGQPVRLWIEKKTSLVRQATYVRKWHNSEFAQWTVRVQKMTLNLPPPQWAIEKIAPSLKGREEPKWVGRAAQDFSLKNLDGRTIGLAALRGKVVLLDFWATWCGPCREEMPLLEKLRDELKSQDVEIWGVTDEPPDVARRWLAERKRSLPTLIDGDRTLFRHYGIESIPVLVVIRGDGKVSSYVVGLRSERDLRADIAKAME